MGEPRKPGRLLPVLAVVAATLLGVYVVLGGTRGIVGIYRLHRDVVGLERELSAARAAVDSLEAEIVKLRADTAYIEKVAREKLGMARRDERVYKFVKEK